MADFDLSRFGKTKAVKDCVWGMMEFSPLELAIIDSPLLQRLRFIKQLGFSYLTYPSADHSRFTHSLGVTHVVKRFVRSINEMAERDADVEIGGLKFRQVKIRDPQRETLAHAALLHDVGHTAFSHVTEAAFMTRADVMSVGPLPLRQFLYLFREANFPSDLSECLSILICLSPRFRDFYRKLIGHGRSQEEVEERIAELCCFIAGVPHRNEFPGLANLISGSAIDADKIDYINRDAMLCGIPVGVDVSRIFLNSSLLDIDQKQISKVASKGGYPAQEPAFQPGVHFVVNSSGIDTYDEIITSKTALERRVYYHQFTRNMEQILSEAMTRAISASGSSAENGTDVLKWFHLGDNDLLGYLERTKPSSELALRIRLRQASKRAFFLSRENCSHFLRYKDLFASAEVHDTGESSAEALNGQLEVHVFRAWNQLVPVDTDQSRVTLAQLRKTLVDETRACRKLLSDDASEDLSISFAPRKLDKTLNSVLIREKNSLSVSGSLSKNKELSSTVQVWRALDYVYADRAWVDYVRLACMKVFYKPGAGSEPRLFSLDAQKVGDEHGTNAICTRLSLNLPDIAGRIGFKLEHLIEKAEAASKKGYFGSAVRAVPLRQSLLGKCDEIAEKFRIFLGEKGFRVSAALVESYLRQFPPELRAEVGQVLLKDVRILTRTDLDPAFTAIVGKASSNGEHLLIGGFSPNSGERSRMLFEADGRDQLKRHGHKFSRGLDELETFLIENNKASVLLLDDQFATGGQAVAQLYYWAGRPRDEWPESVRGEQNHSPSKPGREFLRALTSNTVILAFAYGTKSGSARIEEEAKKLGFHGITVQYHKELPSVAPRLSTSLRTFLTDVGTSLLHYRGQIRGDALDRSVYQADALGYGSAGSVLLTQDNAPSNAITALWCPGIHNDEPWFPLFLRRGHRQYLVFC